MHLPSSALTQQVYGERTTTKTLHRGENISASVPEFKLPARPLGRELVLSCSVACCPLAKGPISSSGAREPLFEASTASLPSFLICSNMLLRSVCTAAARTRKKQAQLQRLVNTRSPLRCYRRHFAFAPWSRHRKIFQPLETCPNYIPHPPHPNDLLQ